MFWTFRKTQRALQILRACMGRAHYRPISDQDLTFYTKFAPRSGVGNSPSQVSKMVFAATKPNIRALSQTMGLNQDLDLPCPHPHPSMHDFNFFHTTTRTSARDGKTCWLCVSSPVSILENCQPLRGRLHLILTELPNSQFSCRSLDTGCKLLEQPESQTEWTQNGPRRQDYSTSHPAHLWTGAVWGSGTPWEQDRFCPCPQRQKMKQKLQYNTITSTLGH